MQSIILKIISPLFKFGFSLYAKLSNELTPIQGIFKESLKALVVATPILIPVKEPGLCYK